MQEVKIYGVNDQVVKSQEEGAGKKVHWVSDIEGINDVEGVNAQGVNRLGVGGLIPEILGQE